MDNCKQEIELLFETSWEVCNKIGGIYAVLSTKAKTLKEQFKDRVIFIGPDVWTSENPSPYFIETNTALNRIARKAMLPAGVDVRVGRWDIPGKPLAVLVKFDGMYKTKDVDYGRMWDLYKVDSLHAYGDYDEGCAFGRAAAAVIEALVKASGTAPDKVVAHFDEWTTAMGLLALKADMPQIATVFTTHATSIGRSICGNGKPLYSYLQAYNGDQMAAELNMQSKHSLEKAAAWQADCFTTVSDVTSREAGQLLEKKADEVTPNGFEPNFVPVGKNYDLAREAARRRFIDVAEALTGNEFGDDTLIVATSGRLEYRNKGYDVYLDALRKLSEKQLARPILAFVLVPGWSAGVRSDLAENIEHRQHGRLSDPIITHRLNNYAEDPIVQNIHRLGFANDAASKVCVIYVPSYLDGFDGILNMTYYQLLPGLDMTVFPSYYEPWGYTPLESVAFGVPTVTTNLSGFGCWAEENGRQGLEKGGVVVVERNDNNYQTVVDTIADTLTHFSSLASKSKDVKSIRAAAKATASMAQWKDFIKYYDNAYCIALSNRDMRTIK